MSIKTVTILSVCVAVIVAGVSGIVVNVQRAQTARANAAAAASAEARAEAERKAAVKVAESESAKAKAEKDRLEAKKVEREQSRAAEEQAKVEREAAIENRKAKEAELAAAKELSAAAKAKKDAALATERAARADREARAKEAEAEALKAQAEADKLATEKLRSEKVFAEAKVLELRQIDFETMARELAEWRQDLEERERALKPENTITNLSWAGGMEDTIIDDKGNVKKQVKTMYDPEKDMTLPKSSRDLARTLRETRADFDAEALKMRKAIVKSLEELYVAAIREGNVINQKFYKENIKSMYPDWEFKGEGK